MATRHKVRRGAAQSGQAIVVVALSMIVLLGFGVLALDAGRYYTQHLSAQNASDMAALAGVYYFSKYYWPYSLSSSDPSSLPCYNASTGSSTVILCQINRVSEDNEIPDTDSTSGNAVNGNVQAWWADINGNSLSALTNDTVPNNAYGIKVQVQIPYRTFIGGLVGQAQLTAQGDEIARLNVGHTPPDTNATASVVVGGSDCNDLVQGPGGKIAHNFSNINIDRFVTGVYVDGSLTVGSVTATDFNGDVKVRLGTGTGSVDGPYTQISPANANPFNSGGNSFNNGAQYYGNVGGPAVGFQNSKWVHLNGDLTQPQIDASTFAPPNGVLYKFLTSPLMSMRISFYQINGDNGTPGSAAAAINTQYNTLKNTAPVGDKPVVFYINGDMVVQGGTAGWPKATLVVAGRFESTGDNHIFGTAGPDAGDLSLLVGKDYGNGTFSADRCASDKSKWVFHINAQYDYFTGLIYVPYGQSLIEENSRGGNNDFCPGLFTYSLYLGGPGSGVQAQSWQFNLNQNLLTWPLLTTELNK